MKLNCIHLGKTFIWQIERNGALEQLLYGYQIRNGFAEFLSEVTGHKCSFKGTQTIEVSFTADYGSGKFDYVLDYPIGEITNHEEMAKDLRKAVIEIAYTVENPVIVQIDSEGFL